MAARHSQCLISHGEAFRYWYFQGRVGPIEETPASLEALERSTGNPRALQKLGLGELGIEPPLPDMVGSVCNRHPDHIGQHCVLVPPDSNHIQRTGVRRYIWTGKLPPNSLMRVSPRVLVSTPEFTFLQLARILDDADLALVGISLCSRYRLSHDETRILEREPLTTRARIERFLDAAITGTHGLKRAYRALSHIADGSRSPMETESFARASWPPELGGYGLKGIVLNHRVNLKAGEVEVSDRPNRQFFEIDLCESTSRCGIEYDGSRHQSTYVADRARSNALCALGFRILRADAAIARDPASFALLMRQFACICGQSLPQESFSFAEARDLLQRRFEGPHRLRL